VPPPLLLPQQRTIGGGGLQPVPTMQQHQPVHPLQQQLPPPQSQQHPLNLTVGGYPSSQYNKPMGMQMNPQSLPPQLSHLPPNIIGMQPNPSNYKLQSLPMNPLSNLHSQPMNLHSLQPVQQQQPHGGMGNLPPSMNPPGLMNPLGHANIGGMRDPSHDLHNLPPPPNVDDILKLEDPRKAKAGAGVGGAKKRPAEEDKQNTKKGGLGGIGGGGVGIGAGGPPEPKKAKTAKEMEKETRQQIGLPSLISGVPSSMMGGGMMDNRPPLSINNPTDDIDNLTERPNLNQEGLLPTDKGIMTGQILDSRMLTQEEFTTKQLLRDNVDNYFPPSQNINALLANADGNHSWIEKNIVGNDMIEKGLISTSGGAPKRLDITLEARKLISEGIQSHLKTLLESVLDTSRKRLNRSAIGNYNEQWQRLRQNEGHITDHHLQNVGLKWGPDVSSLLREEENKMKQIYKDYNDLDEEKLKDKMQKHDEERMKGMGKRKVGISQQDNELHWWEIDVRMIIFSILQPLFNFIFVVFLQQSLEEEGVLSYEKIAEVWKKCDIAVKHELGASMKKKSQKKSDSANENPTIDTSSFRIGMSTLNESNVLMETEFKNPDIAWLAQSPPITYPQETVVSAEDVYTVLSKVSSRKGSLLGRHSASEKIRKARFQWKLFSK
jgi:arsenate reductase-like glutaredoxin family protein